MGKRQIVSFFLPALITLSVLFMGAQLASGQTSSFSTDDSVGCVPFTVNFTNLSTGAQTYLWDFDDGLTSTLTNPTHIFYGTGSYNVMLYAYDSVGSSDSSMVTIEIPANLPFFNLVNIACPGQTIQYTVFGNYDPDNIILWDFGDGTSSSNSFSEHAYSSTGIYTVTLTVVSPVCGVVIDSSDILVTDTLTPPIHIHPEYANTTICPGEAFPLFYDENYSVLWDFGDGSSSSDPYPNHIYDSTGSYTVTVTITNECGNSSSLDTTIIVDDLALPYASAYVTPFPECPNTNLNIVATPGGGYTYLWDFGDGGTGTGQNTNHTYTSTGVYDIILSVTNLCGQVSYDTAQITIEDTLPVNGWMFLSTREVCPADSVLFIAPANMTSYLWDLGDGNFDSTRSFRYSYSDTGSFIIQLTLTNGCSSIAVYYDTIQVTNEHLTTAQFTTDQNTYCLGDVTLFSSVNSDTNNIFSWDFGDGSTGSGPEESHNFTDTGSYLVTLYLTNGCGVTDSVSRTIIVDTISSPVAALAISPFLYSCPDQPIDFINLSSDTGNVLWSFGDGNTSTLANLSHTYSAPGNYFVILQVTNSCGLTSSASQLLTISASEQLEAPIVSCTENVDSITFSWDSIAGATGYEISLDSGMNWIELPNLQLYYKVLGVSGISYSAMVRGLGPEYCKFGAISESVTCIFVGIGLDDITKGSDLVVYPNPGTGFFYIRTNAASSMIQVSVYDMLGRTILMAWDTGMIDLSAATVGSYVIMIQLEDHKIHRHIVIYR